MKHWARIQNQKSKIQNSPHILCTREGQAFVEYAILFAVVAAALLGMQLYAKRGIQASIRMVTDRIGSQSDGIQFESRDRQDKVIASAGFVLARDSSTTAVSDQTLATAAVPGGSLSTAVTTDAMTVTGSLADVGPDVSDHTAVVLRDSRGPIPFFEPPPPPPPSFGGEFDPSHPEQSSPGETGPSPTGGTPAGGEPDTGGAGPW